MTQSKNRGNIIIIFSDEVFGLVDDDDLNVSVLERALKRQKIL